MCTGEGVYVGECLMGVQRYGWAQVSARRGQAGGVLGAPQQALTVEGPEVVVPQAHQVLQGRVELPHDALEPETE